MEEKNGTLNARLQNEKRKARLQTERENKVEQKYFMKRDTKEPIQVYTPFQK